LLHLNALLRTTTVIIVIMRIHEPQGLNPLLTEIHSYTLIYSIRSTSAAAAAASAPVDLLLLAAASSPPPAAAAAVVASPSC
jgi:hypothetical protein